jgi:signal transduction histidine kinase
MARAIQPSEAFDSTVEDGIEMVRLTTAIPVSSDANHANGVDAVSIKKIPFPLSVCFANSLLIESKKVSQLEERDRDKSVSTSLVKSLIKVEQSLGIFRNSYDANGESLEARLRQFLEMMQAGVLLVEQPDNLNDIHAEETLKNAIHDYLSASSTKKQFCAAVDNASRRAVYELAYGLSHEINNPLANIAARAQQLISSASSESDRKSLATIVDQSMRAHEMLAEMMRVIQPRRASLRLENVVPVLQHAIRSISDSWEHSKVSLTGRFDCDPCYAMLDSALFHEAIASLIQNAYQVCRPQDQIEVLCEQVSTPNASIQITVRDTGPGLSFPKAARAFDLYYSGREYGRGLGISLAMVRQIVDAHMGSVAMESFENAGCSVVIRLPVQESPGAVRRAPRV